MPLAPTKHVVQMSQLRDAAPRSATRYPGVSLDESDVEARQVERDGGGDSRAPAT
jgi:hypothetical protein